MSRGTDTSLESYHTEYLVNGVKVTKRVFEAFDHLHKENQKLRDALNKIKTHIDDADSLRDIAREALK